MRDTTPSREAEFVRPRPTPLFGTDRAEQGEAAAAPAETGPDSQRMDEEELQVDGAENEGRGPRMIKNPVMPSADENDRRRRTHLPYRSWCTVCVQANGKRRGHYKVERPELGAPLVGIDFFLKSNFPTEAK